MADYVPLSAGEGTERDQQQQEQESKKNTRSPRLASLDVFRGLCIALMIYVDYAGSLFPSIAHSPWEGLRLADFVTPFFLFIAGISLSLVHKKKCKRYQQSQKAMLRAVKLFLLGILLQGGYFHGVNSLTFGVDIKKLRWFGILQRISIGYIIAAFCEIWCSSISGNDVGGGLFKSYYLHWIVVFSLSGIYLGLLYGLYVPDWQFKVQQTASSGSSLHDSYVHKMVNCDVRGDLGPACNSAGMIDRFILGIDHLYRKPAFRNLNECRITKDGEVPNDAPSWCQAPFDPEGVLGGIKTGLYTGYSFQLQFFHLDFSLPFQGFP